MFLMDRAVLIRIDSRRLAGHRHGCLADHPSGIRPTMGMELYAGLPTISPGGTYFFTVNLLERRQDTLVRHVHALREAVRVTGRERPFHIDAWVVLPDHMHCVWTLPPGDDDFSNRWRAIKIRFVQALPRTERRSHGEGGAGSMAAAGCVSLWQQLWGWWPMG